MDEIVSAVTYRDYVLVFYRCGRIVKIVHDPLTEDIIIRDLGRILAR